MLGGTAGHSSKNRYCPARFGTVDRYEALPRRVRQSAAYVNGHAHCVHVCFAHAQSGGLLLSPRVHGLSPALWRERERIQPVVLTNVVACS